MPKFVHLGCWNNLNKNKKNIDLGNLKQVMKTLKTYIKKNEPEFVVLAGDNYYPGKTKVEGATKKKEKIIYTKKLVEGFSELPKNIEINMILGNHDLETNGTEKSLFIEDTDHPEKEDCYIVNAEKKYVLNTNENLNNKNLSFRLFKDKMLDDGTLLLLLDTSMYTTAASKYLKCHKHFLQRQLPSETYMRDYQSRFIKSKILKYKGQIKHLILIGHHPIIGIKDKKKDKSILPREDKTSTKKTKSEKKKTPNTPILNDIPYFSATLDMIYELLSDEVTYTYLCADLHMYQKGKVTMNKTKMKINQYIVGTGGTELDDEVSPSYLDIRHFKRPDGVMDYELEESICKFGFLECVTNKELPPTCTFIPSLSPSPSSSPSSGGRKTRRKKRF